MGDHVKKAVEILNKGGIVVFPTDTAFGVGCRVDNEKAVKWLFEIRNRPKNQAVPVLVNGVEMAERYVRGIDNDVRDLMKKYWPGGLTVVLEAQMEKVPGLVRGGGSTVGIRMPDHEVILDIIKKAGVPILGPSANFHGEPTPFEFEDLDKKFINLVDYVVPGSCKIKTASTVIDCTVNPWKILREGAVKIKY